MSIKTLDLNLLRVLDTVLTERSVVRAARRLHVTPSAISNALARLRSELGDPLVVRNGRGIVPTPRATSLAASLKVALSELERVVQRDMFDPARTVRQFSVATSDAGQITLIPRLAQLLSAQMPQSSLRVIGIDTYLSSGGIASTEIDVALIAVADGAPGTHFIPLYEEESVLCARDGHPSAKHRITKAQLERLKHVEVQVAPGRGYKALAHSYAQLNIQREVAMFVPSFIAAAAVVARTDLVATLPKRLIQAVGSSLGIGYLRGPAPRVTTQIKLVWHERTLDDPAMRWFRELVVKSLRAADP
jgi:DNA-binding transcriptional LysR family regulator